jgi:hypothetical protein
VPDYLINTICLLRIAEKWCQGVTSFYCFGGHKTTCVNEAFNKVTKEKLNQVGGLKHCWRIDKLVFHLMDTILNAHVMKMQMTLSGMLKEVSYA